MISFINKFLKSWDLMKLKYIISKSTMKYNRNANTEKRFGSKSTGRVMRRSFSNVYDR